ncbi:MAG: BtpA/SgcQ family protein [Planctomycetes bacterium]|nr:BtpA/SgcQ family protein [Planctomycetota bacterium]
MARNDPPRKPIIAMVHVDALPGTPDAKHPLSRIVERAANEAALYARCGVDQLLIENMHDLPYLNGQVGPEIVAAMTAVGLAVRAAARLPLGVQILAAANIEALAVAHAIGAAFVRVENFAFAHVADEGLMPTAQAGPLLRYRRQIGAEAVRVFADIKKKHASHAITSDVSLADMAHAAEFMRADGVIVTGTATGRPTSPIDAAEVKGAVKIPVLIGSGVTPETLPQLWEHADGFIVGSYFKRRGDWRAPIDPDRVRALMRCVARLRD